MENILPWVHAVLKTTPERWSYLSATLPAELLAQPPAPNEWSALECLLHLADAERAVFPVRVRAFLEGRDFAAYNPDREGQKSRFAGVGDPDDADVGDQFELQAQVALLARLTAADLPRQARHPELGMVTLSELLHEWAGHDLMHTVQAERALMQPFIQGSGPWQRYFADHIVAPAPS